MASQHAVVPLGAVPTLARARGAELRKIQNSLTKTDQPDRCSYKEQKADDASVKDVAKPEMLELRLFDEPDALSNMVIVVEGVALHVHKEILAGWSPVFMAMFSSNFAETENNKVVMHGKSLDDVRLLLNCLYPPNTHTVTAGNVMTLLPLADEYDILALKSKCEEILLAEQPSLDILLIAHEYNMPKLLDQTTTSCASLPIGMIDHRKNSELTNHIPAQHMLNMYREKIDQQGACIKSFRNFKTSLKSVIVKLQQWGKHRNSYPCEKHRMFDDNCVLCLKQFRDFSFDQLQNLMDNHRND